MGGGGEGEGGWGGGGGGGDRGGFDPCEYHLDLCNQSYSSVRPLVMLKL